MVAPVQTWTVTVNRKPEEVFAYLVDFPRHGEWSPKPWSAEQKSDGPVGVGTKYTSVGWLPGKPHNQNQVEITEYQPPSKYAFNSTEGVLTLHTTFDLTPEGGGTKVVRTISGMNPPSGINKIIWPVLFPAFVRPAIQKGMNMFKEKAEAQPAAAPGPA